MNRIATIKATNVKAARSFSYQLGAVNVVVGDNFQNKTAILQTIQWLFTGHIAGLPKTNAGIFSLSCGKKMAGSLRLTDGTSIDRSVEQHGESVKSMETIIPKEFAVPDVLLDANIYLSSSERARIQYVFSLAKNIGDKWTGERILKEINETPVNCDTAEQVKRVAQAKKDILERLSESDHQRHEQDGSVQEWLELISNDLKDHTNSAAAELARLEKYQQESINLRWAGYTKASEVEPPNIDQQLKDKLLELQTLREQLAVAQSKQTTAAQNAAIRTEIKMRLAEPWSAGTLNATRSQIVVLEDKVMAYKGQVGALVGALTDASGRVTALQKAIEKCEADLRETERQHEIDLKSPKCPHCGAKGKRFKDDIEIQFQERVSLIVADQAKLTIELETAQNACDLAWKAYKEASDTDKQAQSDRLLLQSLKGELNRLETLFKNRETWQKQLDTLATVEAPMADDLANMTRRVAELTNEVNDLQARQKRWIEATHEQTRYTEAQAQRDQTAAELLTLKTWTKAVERIQSAMVSESFSNILADANKLAADLLLSPIAYHDGEIGRWANAQWIPHRSFSGTESLIACASLSASLARQSPIRILLLDEIGRLTIQNKEKLTERLLKLTAEGFIDQVVMVDVTPEPYTSIQGVNVISV